MESTSYVFSFRVVFFDLVTKDACVRFNQSTKPFLAATKKSSFDVKNVTRYIFELTSKILLLSLFTSAILRTKHLSTWGVEFE